MPIWNSLPNKSQVFNNLLKKYAETESYANMNSKQLQIEMDIEVLKLETEKKIKELREKQVEHDGSNQG